MIKLSMRGALMSLTLAVMFFECTSALAQIKIGQTSGFSGAVSASVIEINTGAKLYLDAVNAEGGINGQTIELVSLDDKFQVPLAVENAKKLIADPKIMALFLNRGTPHVQALMPLLTEGRIPLIAPSTGAMVVHNPVHPWIFNVRATYQRETEAVARHLGLAGIERVGVLYVDDSFGTDASQGALKVFKEAAKMPAVFMAIDRTKPDYTAALKKISEAKPLGILIVGSATSVANGVKAIRSAGHQATIATLSNNAATGFIKELGEYAPGIIVSQVFPSERKLAVPMIAEAAKLASAAKIKQITPAMMEGFAGAKVLVAGLRKAAKDNKEITRLNLKRALENFNRLDIGGLEITYSPTDHTGLDYSDLSLVGVDGTFRR